MANVLRQRRVAERIQHEIGQMLLFDLKDPRLSMVSVTRVTIDRELMQAEVYVSAIVENEAEQADILEVLAHANGFVRREIGKRVQLRHAPAIAFHWDPGPENLDHMSRLLDDLKRNEGS
jgi:ribosome-binding factor A